MNAEKQQRWLEYQDRNAAFSDVKIFGYETVHQEWAHNFTQGLREHLIYLVVSGSCAGTAADQQVRLDPGVLMWLRPAVPFTLATVGARPPTMYRFRLSPAPDVDDLVDLVTVVPDAWTVRGPFDALITELGANLRYRDRRIRAALQLIFTDIFRLTQRGQGGHTFDVEQKRRLERYADEHINERLHPADLAAFAGLAPEYFTRRFGQTYGMPPKVWLVRRRIQHAAVRLDESEEPVSAIARRLGYPDVFLFSRQFKTVMGVSPRNYRSR